MSALNIEIGAQVRVRREDAGKSREELAEFLGVDTSVVCRIENDRISVTGERIARIADFLGCDPGALFPSRRHQKSGRSRDKLPTKAA